MNKSCIGKWISIIRIISLSLCYNMGSKMSWSQLSKPQLDHNSTQPNITLVGLDTKITWQTPPHKLTLAACRH